MENSAQTKAEPQATAAKIPRPDHLRTNRQLYAWLVHHSLVMGMVRYAMRMPAGSWPQTLQARRQAADQLPLGISFRDAEEAIIACEPLGIATPGTLLANANARLIAAAPELLAALLEVTYLLENTTQFRSASKVTGNLTHRQQRLLRARIDARAAIAKAEGRP